ncbi:MAG: hypothetical protein BGO68_01860 [Candidatus Amoebophilus sp. 36-38]|nr:MAG: hypothetical protein BGO68_01860 [Candidatus Amoebophilus sp. 36-38]
MQELNLSTIPTGKMKSLACHASIMFMHKIARMPDSKRIAILVAFVKSFEIIALDDALDIFDLLITDMRGIAKKIGQKKRLRTLKDLDKAALTLADVCTLFLQDEMAGNQLKNSIFLRVSKDKLTESIALINNLTRPADEHFQDEMVQQYGRVCKFLPSLLEHIELKAASGLQ